MAYDKNSTGLMGDSTIDATPIVLPGTSPEDYQAAMGEKVRSLIAPHLKDYSGTMNPKLLGAVTGIARMVRGGLGNYTDGLAGRGTAENPGIIAPPPDLANPAQDEMPVGHVGAMSTSTPIAPSTPAPAPATTGGAMEAAGPPAPYVVRKGDTLGQIAQDHGGGYSKFPAIAAANGIINPNYITPGEKIAIPGYGNPAPADTGAPMGAPASVATAQPAAPATTTATGLMGRPAARPAEEAAYRSLVGPDHPGNKLMVDAQGRVTGLMGNASENYMPNSVEGIRKMLAESNPATMTPEKAGALHAQASAVLGAEDARIASENAAKTARNAFQSHHQNTADPLYQPGWQPEELTPVANHTDLANNWYKSYSDAQAQGVEGRKLDIETQKVADEAKYRADTVAASKLAAQAENELKRAELSAKGNQGHLDRIEALRKQYFDGRKDLQVELVKLTNPVDGTGRTREEQQAALDAYDAQYINYFGDLGIGTGNPENIAPERWAGMESRGKAPIMPRTPATVAAPAVAPPKGAKPTGKTIGGKPAYLLTNGKYWTP